MENESSRSRPLHVLALPYPGLGHINPLLQFCKRLAHSYGIKATLATTVQLFKINPKLPASSSVQLDTISDGYDNGGVAEAETIEAYQAKLETQGSKTLAELITRHNSSDHPIDCIIYDSFLPWALDVAKQFGITGAVFFTQACTASYIFYCVHHGVLKLPLSPSSFPISVEGLQKLGPQDMPSYVSDVESYPAYREMLLNEFSNAHQAHIVLVNTVYELEKEVVDSMSKVFPMLTIGPTIPSIYSDKRIKDDKNYSFNIYPSDSSIQIWLNNKPPRSVVYVSVGSWVYLSNKEMEELALGLKATNFYFLWVVRASDEAKLPENFAKETSEKGLIVKWSPQMEVLSNEAVGCFVTHCGWNSIMEALCLGVPMVGIPQLTDQPTDAKIVSEFWKVGVRAKADENGIVGRQEVEFCIREVMSEGERGGEMKKNAQKWRKVAIEAICEGGSSDKNIDQFVSKLKMRSCANI
ncbi:hypothetical protein UlMin_015995 [Ulmus minor]